VKFELFVIIEINIDITIPFFLKRTSLKAADSGGKEVRGFPQLRGFDGAEQACDRITRICENESHCLGELA
jgi:hypothetical protein